MAKRESETCRRVHIWSLLKGIKKVGGIRCCKLSWGDDFYLSILIDIIHTNKYIHLKYEYDSSDNSIEKIDYKILLASTKCNLGGKRNWFICPLTKGGKYCGRRVAVIYQNGKYFGCRNCNELTYYSQNKNRSKKRGSVLSFLDLDCKIEKMYEKKFNRFYRGRPTKTQRRLNKLEGKALGVSKNILSIKN